MDNPITVKLGEMRVADNGNAYPRASELTDGLVRFRKKLPMFGELNQPEIAEDEDLKAFYKRFGKINPERVAFVIQDVAVEQTPDGKSIIFMGKINPEGPMADSLKESAHQPPEFAMRAYRSRMVGGGKAENSYEIITWDLISPPQK